MEENRTVNRSWRKVLLFWLPEVTLTPGSTLTVLLSLAVSAPALTSGAGAESKLDLDAEVLGSLSVHRLITYIYFHEDLPTLVCSCLIIWYFGAGFEENVGTVKFCYLTPLFAVGSGLLYLAVLATGINLQVDGRVQGFTAVAFSMLSIFIMCTSLKRLVFFGFMVRTKVLPLLFLVLALFVPHAPLLSNVCGILVGVIYSLGGCFFLDPSESMLSRVDEMWPFRVLQRIPFWRYIPASSAERNASQTRKLNPPPGSYPTQQYYTPPQGLNDTYSPYHHMKPAVMWPPAGVSTYPVGAAPGVYHHENHVCSGGHGHSHSDVGFSSNNYEASLQKGFESSPAQPELLQVQTQ
ncbi:rhomboid domain-containing protein 2 isoform X2 [Pseudophryne corroboree]|uniref:rhomboid domain-containing protein 2 isoform X2 n=1 Tax=Pseudophryne corroboree TaxID=495146 RepID=UPI003081A9F1